MNSIFLIGSYLIGAIPFGLLFSKVVGVDVRREGSRNIGATNVGRVLGKKFGFLTLVCDMAKGYLPLLVAHRCLPDTASRPFVVSLCGLLTVLGHMFPLYLRFRGGKGVATGLGVFLYFSPPAIAASLVVFLAGVAGSGFVSVGSLAASALIPFWLWLLSCDRVTIGTAVVIACMIWIKHRDNIGRLLRGEEKTWRKSR